MTPGCFYIIGNKDELKELLKTDNCILIHRIYNQKKWYEFWKRKKVIAYEVFCVH